MGDMADWITEQGMDAHIAHRTGMCDGWCQECEEEDKAAKQRAKKRKKDASRGGG